MTLLHAYSTINFANAALRITVIAHAQGLHFVFLFYSSARAYFSSLCHAIDAGKHRVKRYREFVRPSIYIYTVAKNVDGLLNASQQMGSQVTQGG